MKRSRGKELERNVWQIAAADRRDWMEIRRKRPMAEKFCLHDVKAAAIFEPMGRRVHNFTGGDCRLRLDMLTTT